MSSAHCGSIEGARDGDDDDGPTLAPVRGVREAVAAVVVVSLK
jgi:hypothetical protein